MRNLEEITESVHPTGISYADGFRYLGGEFFAADVTRWGVGHFILVRHIARIDSQKGPKSADSSALTPESNIRVVPNQLFF